MTENDVKTAIIQFLQYSGALVLRINSGAVSGEDGRFFNFVKWFSLGDDPQTAGVADIIALIPGQPPVFLAVECKTPARRNAVSKAQRRFLDAWKRAGGVAVVACGIEDVQEVVRL